MPRQKTTPAERQANANSLAEQVRELFKDSTSVYLVTGERMESVNLPNGKTVLIRSARDLQTLQAAQQLI